MSKLISIQFLSRNATINTGLKRSLAVGKFDIVNSNFFVSTKKYFVPRLVKGKDIRFLDGTWKMAGRACRQSPF